MNSLFILDKMMANNRALRRDMELFDRYPPDNTTKFSAEVWRQIWWMIETPLNDEIRSVVYKDFRSRV